MQALTGYDCRREYFIVSNLHPLHLIHALWGTSRLLPYPIWLSLPEGPLTYLQNNLSNSSSFTFFSKVCWNGHLIRVERKAILAAAVQASPFLARLSRKYTVIIFHSPKIWSPIIVNIIIQIVTFMLTLLNLFTIFMSSLCLIKIFLYFYYIKIHYTLEQYFFEDYVNILFYVLFILCVVSTCKYLYINV